MYYWCLRGKTKGRLASCALWGGAALMATLSVNVMTTSLVRATDGLTLTINNNTKGGTSVLKQKDKMYQSDGNTIAINSTVQGGFNLTISAKEPDLVNKKSGARIKSAASGGRPKLSENEWGYRVDPENNIHGLPSNGAPATIIDNDGKKLGGCESAQKCVKKIIFSANVNQSMLATGEYSTEVVYTATAKIKGKEPQGNKNLSICRSGDSSSTCKVDMDANMIPVAYTLGMDDKSNNSLRWMALGKAEDDKNQGQWYNYAQKQWANAITVKPEALSKYQQGKTVPVDMNDVLGFWTYVPRYAYEVMRRDGNNKPVEEQNFDIKFEKDSMGIKKPAACKDGDNKDYRTECGVNRTYTGGTASDNTTWATHPAFIVNGKAINGIWMSKFEVTGTSEAPTVLPRERGLGGGNSSATPLNGQMLIAKSMGVKDPNNLLGSELSDKGGTKVGDDTSNLKTYHTRMPKNVDWGAAIYLASSDYGTGHGNIRPNSLYHPGEDGCGFKRGEADCSDHITGCGPSSDNAGKQEAYDDVDDFGKDTTCSKSNKERDYTGKLGQLASTTGNVSGIYDMVGGGSETSMSSANWGSLLDTIDINKAIGIGDTDFNIDPKNHTGKFDKLSEYMKGNQFVNSYDDSHMEKCTFETCGGQMLHETNTNYSKNVPLEKGKPADGRAWGGVISMMPDINSQISELSGSSWAIKNNIKIGMYVMSATPFDVNLKYTHFSDGIRVLLYQ